MVSALRTVWSISFCVYTAIIIRSGFVCPFDAILFLQLPNLIVIVRLLSGARKGRWGDEGVIDFAWPVGLWLWWRGKLIFLVFLKKYFVVFCKAHLQEPAAFYRCRMLAPFSSIHQTRSTNIICLEGNLNENGIKSVNSHMETKYFLGICIFTPYTHT